MHPLRRQFFEAFEAGLPQHLPIPSQSALWPRRSLLCKFSGFDLRSRHCIEFKNDLFWAFSASSLNLLSRALVLVARVPAALAAKTTSVLGYDNADFCFMFRIKQRKGEDVQDLHEADLQVAETGCTMISPVLLVSEYSLTEDECQSFCTGS